MKYSNVAVIAHNNKTLGGGLGELREVLARSGVAEPLWYEVSKSKQVPSRIVEALSKGADLFFIWGGDGSVQQAIDTLVGENAVLAILPAGTANLLATNLDVPKDLEQAVQVGLSGDDRRIDVGRINGEHFAVMAGTGLDALMIHDADRALKDRWGRAAYVWTGARNVRHRLTRTKIAIDGTTWFDGKASCVLVGNVASISGGINVFDHASPTDGRLDVAVVTASGAIQWGRVLARAALGTTEKSSLVKMTSAKKIDIRMKRPLPYELDGGPRKKTAHLKLRVVHHAVTIRVPSVREPAASGA